MATEQQGDWRVNRHIHLLLPPDEAASKGIVLSLIAIEGVDNARVHRCSIKLCYDLTRVNYRQLCDHIVDLGYCLNPRWPWRWIARWHQYSDKTGRENAGLPLAHCCNRAPRV